jgi:hypothetical protein
LNRPRRVFFEIEPKPGMLPEYRVGLGSNDRNLLSLFGREEGLNGDHISHDFGGPGTFLEDLDAR